MTKITITREFSGFANVPDNYLIGSDDSNAGTINDYNLPDGYTIDARAGWPTVVRDRDGYECQLLAHPSGHPQLVSLGGSIMSQPVLRTGRTMTSEAFGAWLADMRSSGLAMSDVDCARLLGISANSVVSLKKNGADIRTALACRALLHRLEPYGAG